MTKRSGTSVDIFKERIVVTKDGSLSLSDDSSHAGHSGECMHSIEGALSESLFVYLPALKAVIDATLNQRTATEPEKVHSKIHLCVVGLGLGYLEMIAIAHIMSQSQIYTTDMHLGCMPLFLTSFESNPDLKESFCNWLSGSQSEVHDKVCSDVARSFHILPAELKRFMCKLKDSDNWQFAHALSRHELTRSEDQFKFNVIFFDAYSHKSCADLWNEDFLDYFLNASLDSENPCAFATYASRTSLKRALKKSGFKLIPRRGFMKKRECTLAVRHF